MINLNRVSIILCFLVLSCVLNKARDTTNEAVNAFPPAAQSSAVSATADMADKPPEAIHSQLRDPFWPIGFFPASIPGMTLKSAKSVDPARDKKTALPATGLSGMLKIGGVIRSSGRFYATINGFTVQTGEVVTAVADGEVYKFIVEKIDFKKVQVKPVKQ